MKKLKFKNVCVFEANMISNAEKKKVLGGIHPCDELIMCDCGTGNGGIIWVPRREGCPKALYGLEMCINFDDNPFGCSGPPGPGGW